MMRPTVIWRTLDALVPPVSALECGRIRDVTETTGHSTLHIARHHHVWSLTSVDADWHTLAVCHQCIEQPALAKIRFVTADSVAWLQGQAPVAWFDFVYLDSLNDAEHGMAELLAALPLTKLGGTIMIDDTDPARAQKAALSAPYLRQRPAEFEIVEDVPADATCHGILVVRLRARGAVA